MTARHGGTYLSLALVISCLACAVGCKEKDPPPTHYADLGEPGRPLVPTSAPVHNFKIKDGSADWHPFREPKIPDENAAPSAVPGSSHDAGGNAAADSETDKAIREAVADYNDALANGTTEDLLEFLTEDQGIIAETLLPTLASLNTKLGQLAAAIPAQATAIEAVRSQLAASSLLKIEIASVKTTGEKDATVTLANSPLPAFLPGLSDYAKAALDVTFSYGEDEYWYIESPVVTAMGGLEPALKLVITEIDGVVSGAAAGDPATALAAAARLAPMLQAVAAPASKEPVAGDSPVAADAPKENTGG